MADTPAGLILVSFDIDGTLEAGDPPGPVTFAATPTSCPARRSPG
jgi:hypothetical protein